MLVNEREQAILVDGLLSDEASVMPSSSARLSAIVCFAVAYAVVTSPLTAASISFSVSGDAAAPA